jgi:hypothetical protein
MVSFNIHVSHEQNNDVSERYLFEAVIKLPQNLTQLRKNVY